MNKVYLYLIQVCYVIGNIEGFITKITPFQLLHAGETLWVFALRTSALGLISSQRLDVRKVIRSLKWSWHVLHAELQALVLNPLLGNKECNERINKLMIIIGYTENKAVGTLPSHFWTLQCNVYEKKLELKKMIKTSRPLRLNLSTYINLIHCTNTKCYFYLNYITAGL